MQISERVLVTGGAGYVGAVLVPRLLQSGYAVRVLDLCLYGSEALAGLKNHPRFELIQGDIRDEALLEKVVPGCPTLIHLACISNDPSFELDPALGRSINYDAFFGLVRVAKKAGVRRFVYASSSSVYGVKDVPNVTEDLPLEPLTDYSRFKAMCEDILLNERRPGFRTLVLRPATVCGYSPRLRLDLTVNIFSNHAFHRGFITLFGGSQRRPNIHIADMSDAYLHCLAQPEEVIDGKIYNVGFENHTLTDIAHLVCDVVGPQVEIRTSESNDLRSYHISAEAIRRELGFIPRHTIRDAVVDLIHAFRSGWVSDPLNNSRYYNIKTMQQCRLAPIASAA